METVYSSVIKLQCGTAQKIVLFTFTPHKTVGKFDSVDVFIVDFYFTFILLLLSVGKVGIVAGYRLDNRCSISGRDKRFFPTPQRSYLHLVLRSTPPHVFLALYLIN
jgi:hypothetical protein